MLSKSPGIPLKFFHVQAYNCAQRTRDHLRNPEFVLSADSTFISFRLNNLNEKSWRLGKEIPSSAFFCREQTLLFWQAFLLFVTKYKSRASPTTFYSSVKSNTDPSLRLWSTTLFEKVKIPSPSSIHQLIMKQRKSYSSLWLKGFRIQTSQYILAVSSWGSWIHSPSVEWVWW